jgi:hypothetical protein
MLKFLSGVRMEAKLLVTVAALILAMRVYALTTNGKSAGTKVKTKVQQR